MMLKKRFTLVAALIFFLIVSLFMLVNTGFSPPPEEEEDYDRPGGPWAMAGRPLFPENLVLRGICHNLYNIYIEDWGYLGTHRDVLIDQNMPYPPGKLENVTNLTAEYPYDNTSWTLGQAWFVHQAYPQTDYYIQGDVIISFVLGFYLRNLGELDDTMQFNITVRLQKLDLDGYVTEELGSERTRLVQVVEVWRRDPFSVKLDRWPMGGVFTFQEPVTVNAGERLCIKFEAWARSDWNCTGGLLRLWHSPGSDELKAVIPIVYG